MASLTKGIFIVAAKRTPIGSFGGKLAGKTSTDLQEIAFRSALASGNLDPKLIDSVVVGNVQSSTSIDGSMISRHAGLRVGVPVEKPALTINRLCGSGFQAVVTGAHDILMGDSSIVLTGGSENMSQAPFIVRNVRFGTRLGTNYQFEDSLWVGLSDHGCATSMGQTAENLAEKFGITRDEAEAWSLESQRKWKNAHDNGYFAEEMAPVQLQVKGQPFEMNTDEHPRVTSKEALAKLPSIFKKGGTVTAGTASGISDGASCIVLASEAACTEYNLKPLARLVGYGIAGVEPRIMGIGPVPAIQKLMSKTGKNLGSVELVEINEAFATQTVACVKDLGLDPSRVNVNGGAVAMGHPVGASGSRITAHLVHELRRRKAKYGIGSACIGGGQGIAVLIESLAS